ncbi:MAG TPA: maleylpyruvate isomerase family mycothiol-dependent enzyme [Jiangellales bacterium]|nr:maleylpyruvate isomerase family mycothiol-dependent enzyme [Jiangellales bacterium]
MDHAGFVAHIRADADRILALAPDRPDDPVPTCPGWTVRDVVEHTAQVFAHKATIMREGAMPEPWPPSRDATPMAEHFAATRDALLHELTTRAAAQGCPTWWPDDQTVGFWGRRMAHEAAVHRLDVEIALGQVTPVDAALAVDGVDEVLRRFLAGDWSDEPVAEGAGTVVEVATGDRRWRVVLEPKAVVVVPSLHDLPVDATITGDPVTLYRWAWGRGEADRISVEGDPDVRHLLRARLAAATQ